MVQLWDDLSNYRNANPAEHFLGPLIVTRSGSGTLSVVDGQQRLTTIQMMLALIRDQWIQRASDANSLANNAKTAENLIQSLTMGGSINYRFIPNRYLKDIFFNYVQLKHGDPERKYVRNKPALKNETYFKRCEDFASAYLFLEKKLEGLDDPSLIALQQYLMGKVLFLQVIAEGENNAFLLFETLNARGLDLGQSDLIKSYIFSQLLPADDEQAYVAIWDAMISNLGNTEADVFLRHYMLLVNKGITRHDLYRKFKEMYRTPEAGRQLLRDLQIASRFYGNLIGSERVEGQEFDHLNALFEQVQGTKVDSQNIFLLALLLRFLRNFDKSQLRRLEKACRFVEILSFRWVVCGQNAQDLENLYQSASQALIEASEEALSATLDTQLKKLQESFPRDEVFRESLKTAVIRQNPRAKYILRRIDAYQNGKGSYILVSGADLHLEHVAPQKPSEGSPWEIDMQGNLTYTEVVYSIGNMVLLPARINNSISNKPFKEKKIGINNKIDEVRKELGGHLLLPVLTQEVLMEAKWDQAVVTHRAQQIAELACKVWGINAAEMPIKELKPGKGRRRKASKNARKAVAATGRRRRARRAPKFTFAKAGIPPGATLRFVDDPKLTARVVDERLIFFNGETTSLSGATLAIMRDRGSTRRSFAGPQYWIHDGRTCSELAKY